MPGEWVFPHSTCERTFVNTAIIQPYSFGMNFLNAAFLMRSAYISPTSQSRMAIASFVLFELFHMLSHAVHMDRNIHEIVIHACGYAMAITVNQAMEKETGHNLTTREKLTVLSSVFLDLIVFSSVRNIYSIATGLSVLAVTIAQYLPFMPKDKQKLMRTLVLGTIALFGMFVVEKQCCDIFKNWKFDYHPWIVETWGIFLFQLLARLLTSEIPSRDLSKDLF